MSPVVDEDEDPYAGVRELEQRMQLLKWRKAETDARIKAMLADTRQMQEADLMVALAHDRTTEKSSWMQRVISEELQRPLTVDDDYLRTLEEDERRQAARARAEVARHHKVLRKYKRDIKTAAARTEYSPGLGSSGGSGGGFGRAGASRGGLGLDGGGSGTLSLPSLGDSVGARPLTGSAAVRLKELEKLEKEVKRGKRRLKKEAKAVPLSATLRKQGHA